MVKDGLNTRIGSRASSFKISGNFTRFLHSKKNGIISFFSCQGLEIALLGYKTIFLLDPIIKLGIARNCRSLSSFFILATQFVIVVLLAKSKQLYFCENWISER